MWKKKKIWSSSTEKLQLVSLGGTKGAGAWEKGYEGKGRVGEMEGNDQLTFVYCMWIEKSG